MANTFSDNALSDNPEFGRPEDKTVAAKVGDGAKVAAQKVGEGAKATGDYVKSHPIKTAAAVGGAALAAGAAVAGTKLYQKKQASKSTGASKARKTSTKAKAPKINPQAE